MLGLSRTPVAEAERDLPVLETLEPAVDERDAEDVTGQVLEDLLAAPRVLEMHHPVFAPDFGWDLIGAEEDREDSAGDEEVQSLGRDPAWSGGSHASRRR